MYWPSEGSATFGEFVIETSSHEIFQDFSERELTVAKKKVRTTSPIFFFDLDVYSVSSGSIARGRFSKATFSHPYIQYKHLYIFNLGARWYTCGRDLNVGGSRHRLCHRVVSLSL